MTQESANNGGAKPKVRADDKRGGSTKGAKGNQPFVPTDEQRADVRGLSSILTLDQIAIKLGVSKATIQRHFKKELAEGVVNAVALVGNKVLQQALNGDKASQFFYLKTRGGYTQRHEHTGKDGAPIEVRSFDFSHLSLEEKRIALKALDGVLEAANDDRDAA